MVLEKQILKILQNASKESKYIEECPLLIFESCCMDEYDSITNGFNIKHSVDMFRLY
jgi:hypothetical protein